MPYCFKSSAGPIPESCNIWTEFIDPADKITSDLARASMIWRFCSYSTPTARPFSKITLRVTAFVSTRKKFPFTVLKKALAVLVRQPARWFTRK